MNKIKIVSAISSRTGITLYLKDGNTLELPNDGWRTRAIMDEVTRPLAQHKTVEIDLDRFSLEKRIEAQTGGFIRFVKKTWSSFKETMFGGTMPDGAQAEQETLVAVVGGVGGREIPGMEKIEKQIEHAALKDAKGFQRFLERLTKVIDQRGHTVQELLDFMSKGDLPISDDGYIVAYKSLYRTDKDGYIDCHSRTVKQRVGSLVTMDVNLVDPNRRVECSYGLHVGRRAYMGSFSGDVMTLIIINPADVVAVPLHDPNKMRVAAYHIVGELSARGREEVRKNKPMTSVEADAKLLADVLRGQHVPVLEKVMVGKNGILTQVLRNAPKIETNNAPAKALDDKEVLAPVTVKEVKSVIAEVVAEKKAKQAVKAAGETLASVTPETAQKAEKIVSPSGRVLKDRNGPVDKPAKKASAAPAKPAKKADYSHIPEKWRDAYAAVVSGQVSQREAEKLYRISAKKLRALLRDNGDLK